MVALRVREAARVRHPQADERDAEALVSTMFGMFETVLESYNEEGARSTSARQLGIRNPLSLPPQLLGLIRRQEKARCKL